MTNEANSVYLLQHVHRFPNQDEDVKILGIFATREDAETAIAGYKSLEGFKDTPDDFSIDRYELNKREWVEGYMTVE